MSSPSGQPVYQPQQESGRSSAWPIVFGGILVAILVLMCMTLSVLVTVLLVMDLPLTDGIGEQTVTIENVTNIEESYEWSIGQQTIDLHHVVMPAGETEFDAHLGAGELIIIVPDNVAVDVDWDVGIGNASIFGEDHSGVNVDGSVTDPNYEQTKQQLRIDVSVGIGRSSSVTIDLFRSGRADEGEDSQLRTLSEIDTGVNIELAVPVYTMKCEVGHGAT